jgi:hypothetical protein
MTSASASLASAGFALALLLALVFLARSAAGDVCLRLLVACRRACVRSPSISLAMPALREKASAPLPPGSTLALVVLQQLYSRFPPPGTDTSDSAARVRAFNPPERQLLTARLVRAELEKQQADFDAFIARGGGPGSRHMQAYTSGFDGGLAGKCALRIAAVDARIAELEAGAAAEAADRRRDCANAACMSADATRPPRKSCDNCGARYCSAACQAAHWPAHRCVCLNIKYEREHGSLGRGAAENRRRAAAGLPLV